MKIIKFFLVVLSILNVFLFYEVCFGPRSFFAYKRLAEQKNDLELKIKNIIEDNIKISEEIKLIKNDREYQEYNIRKILHMGKDNEVMYIISR